MTQEQVDEIDRQKAASRAEDQADKIAMKHRGRNYRDGGTREGEGAQGCWILTKQLILSQPGGRLCPPHYYNSPEFSGLPTALGHAIAPSDFCRFKSKTDSPSNDRPLSTAANSPPPLQTFRHSAVSD